MSKSKKKTAQNYNSAYPKFWSVNWQWVRELVLARDLYQCTRCGKTDQLHVHHLNYERIGHEELEDLVTLCRECHIKEHGHTRL